jgi:hypothetical protein
LTELGRHAEALKDYDRAEQLAGGLGAEPVSLSRALSLAHAGKPEQAGQEVAALVAGGKAAPHVLYKGARAYAACAAAGNIGTKLAEAYAARALDLLRRAGAAGFFEKPAAVEGLKKDKEFAGLRSHGGFAALLAELEAKLKTQGR